LRVHDEQRPHRFVKSRSDDNYYYYTVIIIMIVTHPDLPAIGVLRLRRQGRLRSG
jgi:hypothetical protein